MEESFWMMRIGLSCNESDDRGKNSARAEETAVEVDDSPRLAVGAPSIFWSQQWRSPPASTLSAIRRLAGYRNVYVRSDDGFFSLLVDE